MRFQVPQFVEIEDKIIGPLTIKQFVYLAGGLGLVFSIFSIFPRIIAFLSLPFIIAFIVALAFYKPSGRPFVFVLEAALTYYLESKLYVWKKRDKKIELKKDEKKKGVYIDIPKLSDSKLSDLSWNLDIKEKLTENMNNN